MSRLLNLAKIRQEHMNRSELDSRCNNHLQTAKSAAVRVQNADSDSLLPADTGRHLTRPANENAGAEISSAAEISLAKTMANRFPKIIPFDSLARCGEEIWIENNGQIYRLRKTKQGKLILTK